MSQLLSYDTKPFDIHFPGSVIVIEVRPPERDQKGLDLESAIRSLLGPYSDAVIALILSEDYLTREREQYHSGLVPQEYVHRIPFMYAQNLIYAADTIGKMLQIFKNREFIPDSAKEVCESYYSFFPQLKHVRDSAHHYEDRSRGKARETPISPKDPAFEVGNLFGQQFRTTLADGSLGSLEISPPTVIAIRDRLQALINCFEWDGWSMTFPYSVNRHQDLPQL